jgi:hypothetical protein
LHYVQTQLNHIQIDFDQAGENGEKDLEKNIREASKWPPTYAELSKSGAGIHLHYFYTGDPSKLSRIYDDHIEVKMQIGNSSLRRKLTKCNDLPIASISSGLPLKEDNKTVNFETVKSEKALRTWLKRNLNKEYHAHTSESVQFIKKILDDAYNSDLFYDVTDMRNAILAFAADSTHQSADCIKLVSKMQFKSKETSHPGNDADAKMVFFDVEVFPNLFLVNWKIEGKGKPIVRMINPRPAEIEELMRFRLVGFNCRRYDNHILYGCLMGYTPEQLYELSQRIINGSPNCFFGEAYNVSYTDVYDFASAGNKKSLKKFEIELGIHHQELGLPWDQPVPEELWTKVAEYCDNDVIATEAVFYHLAADWTARQILADLAGMTVNDTTNTLTTRIIFGTNRNPQSQFNYRDLSQPVKELDGDVIEFLKDAAFEMMAKPHGPAESILPYFPGYEYKNGVSRYRGVEIGEGGNVYAEPGMYGNAALLDVMSMHPHSAIMEVLFGVEFTKRFKEIVDGRVGIKHEAWEIVNGMLDGKLTPYIQKVINGEMTCGQLANALKTAINSVYGLTAAGFDNPFRDPRNVDNIVAKRGALFMEDLKHAVWEKGFKVAHIKTDSIKIPDATPEIIQFVMDFGKRYGYTFEHEATYDRICLVNDAVYIAKYKGGKHDGEWTATGTQFSVPYVFKKLFSHEEVVFEDLCETKSVSSAIYLDFNECKADVTEYEKELKARHPSPVGSAFGFSDEEMKSRPKTNPALSNLSDDDLRDLIIAGHDYRFVGKVGNFCPMKPGCGGALLLRETINAKTGERGFAAVTGSKGRRWMESEQVKKAGMEDCIDRSYYDSMVDEAVKSISKYGDFEWFVSDDPYVPVVDDGLPPW